LPIDGRLPRRPFLGLLSLALPLLTLVVRLKRTPFLDQFETHSSWIEVYMIQNVTRLRFACGVGTLFLALSFCWIFEVFAQAPRGHLLWMCCKGWRALQLLPYLAGQAISDPIQPVNLPVFWLVFSLQWFVVGTVVLSQMVIFLGHVVDLVRNQNAEPVRLPSVLGVEL
jgi:hypothetical protein